MNVLDRPRHAATADVDLFSSAALADPYPLYKQLRDTGPAVWLQREKVFAISRFADVKEALRDAQTYSSAQGIGLNGWMNRAQRGAMLASDNPRHNALRAVVGKPLLPAAVRELQEQIASEAEALIERLVARGSFDAVADLAWHLPLAVVSHLVGLPEKARRKMPAWAAAGFNTVGPLNWRTLSGMPSVLAFVRYINQPGLPAQLKPGSWGARLFEAADRGEIDRADCAGLLADYFMPSLDTTVSATSSLLWLLAQHPEQWAAIRDDASLIPNAVLEAIRLETPIPAFSRVTTGEAVLDGVALPPGKRVFLLYASANRDERKWDAPERFDIRRKVAEHLGFGLGTHSCMGMHLAQLEIRCLLTALARRVERFSVGQPTRAVNNGLRALASLPMTVVPLAR